MNRDIAFGGASLALAAGYYVMATAIPESLLADAIGPEGLPKTYAVLLGLLSLVLIVKSLRRGAGVLTDPDARTAIPDPRSPAPDSRSRTWRVAGMLAIGAIYVAVVPWLGYVLSLTGLIVATTYYQGGGFDRRVAIVALSGALLFWLLFVVLLGIPHPAGFWPSLF